MSDGDIADRFAAWRDHPVAGEDREPLEDDGRRLNKLMAAVAKALGSILDGFADVGDEVTMEVDRGVIWVDQWDVELIVSESVQ